MMPRLVRRGNSSSHAASISAEKCKTRCFSDLETSQKKPRVDIRHVQGPAAVIVGDPPPQHKGLVKIDEMGIAAKGLGKGVGLEDGRCVFEGDKLLSSRWKRRRGAPDVEIGKGIHKSRPNRTCQTKT